MRHRWQQHRKRSGVMAGSNMRSSRLHAVWWVFTGMVSVVCQRITIAAAAAAIVTIALTSITALAQPQPEALRCSFHKEYARHNWLAFLTDEFDSTIVEWSFGEVRIDYPSDTQFVFLEMSREEFFSQGRCCSVRGTPTPGPDGKLGEAARTQVFSYREGSSMTFVRQTSTQLKGSSEVHISALDAQCPWASWRDWKNAIYPQDVLDTMEVALELVDASTQRRLLLLDSVQLYASPGCKLLTRRGTNPNVSVHRVQLPGEFANRRVYVRPLPYRRGPTPLGLQHTKEQFDWNVAHLLYDEHTTPLDNLPRWLADPQWYPTGKTPWDTMQTSYADEYIRTQYAQLGGDSCIPTVFGNKALPRERATDISQLLKTMGLVKYSQRCFDRNKADTAWILSTLLPVPLEKQRIDLAAKPAGQVILRARSMDGNLLVTLDGTKSQRNRIVAYDVTGAEIFRGTCPPAPFADVQIPLPNSIQGSVFIRCMMSDGTEVSTSAQLVR
ncbi:MAG: hypothetical protein FGM32_02525 [Candidatus Kapabacteria bacterium]|nr:hypothetical protein [Candidatus Kapabacteria bacterium]